MLQNAGIVLKIFAFYLAVIVLLGLYGMSADTALDDGCPSDDLGCNIPSMDDVDSILDIPAFLINIIAFFFSAIFFSISALGWLNLILFLPLGITILYIALEVGATAVP